MWTPFELQLVTEASCISSLLERKELYINSEKRIINLYVLLTEFCLVHEKVIKCAFYGTIDSIDTETQVLLIIFWRRKCFRTNVPILITRHIIPVRKKEELLNIIDPVSYMRLKFIDTQFPCCHTGCQAAIVSWYCKNRSSMNSTIFWKKI